MPKKMTKKQRDWCARYQKETGFEVLFVEELESGQFSFEEFVNYNLGWLRDWLEETVRGLEEPDHD